MPEICSSDSVLKDGKEQFKDQGTKIKPKNVLSDVSRKRAEQHLPEI